MEVIAVPVKSKKIVKSNLYPFKKNSTSGIIFELQRCWFNASRKIFAFYSLSYVEINFLLIFIRLEFFDKVWGRVIWTCSNFDVVFCDMQSLTKVRLIILFTLVHFCQDGLLFMNECTYIRALLYSWLFSNWKIKYHFRYLQ